MFTPRQESAIRANCRGWLAGLALRAGGELPALELNTENGAWAGDALQL